MTSKPNQSFSPLDPNNQSASWKFFAVAVAIACLSVASYIEIPMVPVPITAQTYVLLTIAGLLGWKLGIVSTVLWLALGALGLPVLAGGSSGLDYFAGPTAGYLFAFPLAVAVVGLLFERGWNTHNIVLAFLAMLLGHAVCLGFGGAWLALTIGPEKAFLKGVLPFLLGGVIKSALAVGTILVVDRFLGSDHDK
ncbi:biotin transporter BioY [Marinobacter sp.]|uniref:biotin transporter BioY n=1 Tax=Marinobacter sp. TaxID=50741 RepID=UPI001B55E371|nr:biotin transporter BioY [Marinobacter sp.]MBQ0832876.1 biotin transporter BioY [Marinobacter sp.]